MNIQQFQVSSRHLEQEERARNLKRYPRSRKQVACNSGLGRAAFPFHSSSKFPGGSCSLVALRQTRRDAVRFIVPM